MSILSIEYIGDVTFGPTLTHKAEDIAVAKDILSGHGPVEYESVYPEVALCRQEIRRRECDIKFAVSPLIANSRAKTNLDTESSQP
jgi:pyruvate/2-oxoglutarate dehydrogenase complex dihydrolipoamide dehydrogenase (E3) component